MEQPLLDFSSFFDLPAGAGSLTAGISLAASGSLNPFTREGRRARSRFFAGLGHEIRNTAFLRQIHSRRVLTVGRIRNRGRRADGLVTRRRDILLTVTAADCMPVYLVDGKTGTLGLCHSGWKGTGIVKAALDRMERDYGCRREDTTVLLGPAIGSCCYRVDDRRAREFSGLWGEEGVVSRDGEYFLDLRGANRKLLSSMGLRNVIDPGLCTFCRPEFGSFRREGPENYTRMTAYLGYSPGI